MKLAPIVGFCGLAYSGKTTAALHLTQAFAYRRLRVAEPLKAMLAALGLSKEEIDGSLKEQPSELLGGKTPRWAMQTLGTEWGRDLIAPDLWLNAWLRKVDAELASGHLVTCDDVRFVNEAEAIRARGGIIIKVTSPRVKGTGHISEKIPFEWDREINNDLTLDSLFKRVATAAWIEDPALAA